MAKTMTFENCVALEVVSRSTDKDGKPLKNKAGEDVSYYTLVAYEFGNKFPELLKLSVYSSKLDEARALAGRKCNILANVSLFKDQMSLYFESGSVVPK